jgi:hypothetical protein
MKHIIKTVILLAIASNATAENFTRPANKVNNKATQLQSKTNTVDTPAAPVAKKSCGSCNKPKECVVREKKACGSCAPKVERPKKECHTCNKCHRPVAPKATKCGRCNHPVTQDIDNNIDEETAVIVDGAAA